MTAVVERTLITEPGVYDLPVADYHADPVAGGSLSSTGARKLLPPGCPALFAYERENPPTSTATFDFGHAAHRMVLGAGPELVVVDADDWRTKAAREARDEARAAGQAPVLTHQYETVQMMAAALRAHPTAARLLDADAGGAAEQTLVWQDDESGVWCRALLDWLPARVDGRRLIIVDYKSAASAEPGQFARAAASYGYFIQAAFYLAGVRAVGLDDNPAFVFVAQAKEPPYLVSCTELDVVGLEIGALRAREAIGIYRRCVEANHWPGYGEAIEPISLPAWMEREYLGVSG